MHRICLLLRDVTSTAAGTIKNLSHEHNTDRASITANITANVTANITTNITTSANVTATISTRLTSSSANTTTPASSARNRGRCVSN